MGIYLRDIVTLSWVVSPILNSSSNGFAVQSTGFIFFLLFDFDKIKIYYKLISIDYELISFH